MCDITHSCVTRLVNVCCGCTKWAALFMCDMAHSCVTWLINVPGGCTTWVLPHSCVTWLIHARHDSLMWDTTHSCVRLTATRTAFFFLNWKTKFCSSKDSCFGEKILRFSYFMSQTAHQWCYTHPSTYQLVTSHMNESCHTWMAYISLECILFLTWFMSHMDESCPIWVSQVTHMNEPCHAWISPVTHQRVTSRMNEKCPT